MAIGRRIAVGLAWMFAGNWSEQIANFVVFIVLVRLLGPEAFGLAAMATVFVLLAEFLVRETMTETLIQLPEVEPGHRDALFWLLGGFSLAVMGGIMLFAAPIAALFDEPRVAPYVVGAAPTVAFIGLAGVPVASLRRDLEFRVLALRATAGVVAGGVVGVAMALSGFGVWSLVVQRLVQVFVNSALAWVAYPFRPGLRAERRHLRAVLSFGGQMVGLRAAELFSLNAPTLVVGAALGPVWLGLYTVAWRFIEILSLVLIAPIRIVAQPAFAHLSRHDRSAGRLLDDVVGASSLVTFASFLGLAAVAEPLTRLLFGADWAPAVPAMQVLCLVGVYLSIERLQQSFCIALGRARGLVVLSVVEAALGFAAMAWVVDRGLVAVAAAFAGAYYAVWPFRFALVTGIAGLRVRPYLAQFALPLVGAAALFAVVLGFQRLAPGLGDVPLLAGSLVLGVLVYATFVAVTMPSRLRALWAALQSARSVEESP